MGTKSIIKIILLLLVAFIIYLIYYLVLNNFFPEFSTATERTFVYSFIPVTIAVVSSYFAYKSNSMDNIGN